MKDSGIVWIGEIPKEWEIGRLKNVCYGFSNGTSAQQTSTGETNFAVTRIETISQGIINYDKVGYINTFEGIEKFKLKKDDILISNINSFAQVGKCSMYYGEHDLYHGMNLIRISPKQNVNSKFLLAFLKSEVFTCQMQCACKPAINQVSVPSSTIKQFCIPMIPFSEQERIATYLDEKCKEIDALVTLQEKMITELQAYKQSVISEAVTKGLDTKVMMKDSGVEWIGEIPEHWEILRHKNIMHKVKEIEETYHGQDIISLTMNGVIIRNLSLGGKIPLTFDGYQKVYKGNLLLCLFDIDVTPRCVGLIKNNGVTSPAYSQFVMHKNICAAYYDYLLRYMDDYKCMLHLTKNLRSSLTETDFGAIYTICPPLSEQQAIADYLDTQCTRIDSLIALKQTKIDSLKEYKKSVIYEYVTGKKEVPATV